MSRRRVAQKRQILPDPKYKSHLLAKFINHIMKHGKKSIAEMIVYQALALASEKAKGKATSGLGDDESSAGSAGGHGKAHSSIDLLKQALDQVRPTVEVRSRRVGGATYQVPVEVRELRSYTLAMRWIVQSARERSEKGMTSRLAHEILDILAGRGESLKKRENMHRMAKANQAFAHFRWN